MSDDEGGKELVARGDEDGWNEFLFVGGWPERGHHFTTDPGWLTVLALVAFHEGLGIQTRLRLRYLEAERRFQTFVEVRVGSSGGPLFSVPARIGLEESKAKTRRTRRKAPKDATLKEGEL